MEDELAEFKRNKDFIIAQAKTAEVKKQIYEAKANIKNDKSADDLMARMKAKAERASHEAAAAQEMADTGGGSSLEKEFESLGGTSASADVQAKLDAMKAKMGS
jgi:phage shock protein A